MKYKVLFKHFIIRKNPISSGFRPNWTNIKKPDQNCAIFYFSFKDKINPGEECEGILMPLVPEFWSNIIVGDILQCMEGSRQIGEAIILEVINE